MMKAKSPGAIEKLIKVEMGPPIMMRLSEHSVMVKDSLHLITMY